MDNTKELSKNRYPKNHNCIVTIANCKVFNHMNYGNVPACVYCVSVCVCGCVSGLQNSISVA